MCKVVPDPGYRDEIGVMFNCGALVGLLAIFQTPVHLRCDG